MTSLTNLLGISFIGLGVTSVLLYTIQQDLGLTGVQVGLLVSAQSLVMWTAVFMGMLADRYGVRKVCGIGLIITSISAVLRGLSYDFLTFFITTIIFGIGQIIFIPNPPKLLRVWFSSKELGLANGINMAGVGAGSAIAASITALYVLPAVGSWQVVYFVYSIPTFIGVILWWILVRDNPHGKIVSERKLSSLTGLRHVINLRSVRVLASIRVFSGLAMIAFSSFLPYLLQMRGFLLEEVGLMTSARLWCRTLGCFMLPMLSDRLKKRRSLFIISCFITTLSSFLMLIDHYWLLWMAPILYGFFGGGSQTLSLTIMTEDVGATHGGTTLGFLMTLGSVVSLVGSLIVGLLVDLYDSFTMPFMFSAITSSIMLILSVLVKETYITTI